MILLSFDIEEFDMPFEYEREISFEDQMQISITGTKKILEILDKHQVKATFFSTATFALNAKELIIEIVSKGHEIASHGYYHSSFEKNHYADSKKVLEDITQQEIIGFRMARMQPVDNNELQHSGYLYNSSINPTYLPGRYNNLHVSRTYFKEDNLLQIPASVSPLIRFPLFWLSFHNLPIWLYTMLSKWTLKKDNYLNIYFHPWEFTPLNDKERFNFPGYVSKNSGDKMISRMNEFIEIMKKKNYSFETLKSFYSKIES